MKRKFFSVLLALVLVCSFSMVTAVPAAAQATLTVAPFILEADGDGIAEWSTEEYKSGSSSVKLAADTGHGKVVMPLDMAFSAINDFSVWVEGGTEAEQSLPLLAIELEITDTTDIDLSGENYYGPGVTITDTSVDFSSFERVLVNSQPGQDEGWSLTLLTDALAGFELYGTHTDAGIDVSGAGESGTETGNKYWGIQVFDSGGNWGIFYYFTWEEIHTLLDPYATVIDVKAEMHVPYPAGLSTVYVDDITINDTTYYGLIQDAIDAADPGDIINVAAGTYTESLLVDKADLTLRSLNGKAVTTIQLVDGVGIDIQGGADNFKLGGASGQGFTIDDGASTTFDIQLANAPSGVEISYNTIDTVTNASMGISVGAAGASGLNISNNTISAGTGDGAIWGPNVANVTVSNNTLSGGSYGVQFSGVTGTSTISSNTISSFTGSGGIVISNGAGTSGLTITGNTISNCSNGIYFVDYTAEGTPANMTTVTVTYNTISGSTNAAIKIGNGTYVLASNFTIMYNAFINSTNYGLENLHSTEQVTAEKNWWNDVAGPNHAKNPYNANSTGDDVTDDVDYIPWMIHTELASGWNVYSTPIAPDASSNTIVKALNVWGVYAWGGDDLALYFDGSDGEWKEATSLTPLQGLYIKMGASANISVVFSTDYSETPSQTMYGDWNLIGLAELYDMDAQDALATAYYVAGANNIGYGQVVSPPVGQTAWGAVRGPAINTDLVETMSPTEGYWLFMVNQGTLAGFTSTPIAPLP